jgi:hypothetical protein
MVECLIKTIKHGITILSTTPENANSWDEQLAKVMFRYKCRIQANTKFSPFMILNGRTPHLRVDNYLHSLIIVVDDIVDAKTIVKQFLQKMKFVATLTWPSVGVKPNTWKSWGFGVLRDSRMFRARQQGEKHLALGCSWCHWKGLETQISKMPSHWQFGHLQPKLWAKEGPGVKLPV